MTCWCQVLSVILVMVMVMKISRLIEITMLLLNREKVTAGELARRFQVSPRTIYRDVEDLSAAGVPVYMARGSGGGISLLPDWSLDRMLLSPEDRESLVLAIQTLQATRLPGVSSALQKLGALFGAGEQWAQVDFSPWGSHPEEGEKFDRIRDAILQRRVVKFQYINSQGETSTREVEPMKLQFKGQAWYLHGYCRTREDFRLFRLSRVRGLTTSGENFQRQRIGQNDAADHPWGRPVKLKLKFQPALAHRVYDDFSEKAIAKNRDGTLTVTATFPEDQWVYGYILSFGCDVEVLEPAHVREIILGKLKQAIALYQ